MPYARAKNRYADSVTNGIIANHWPRQRIPLAGGKIIASSAFSSSLSAQPFPVAISKGYALRAPSR